MNDSCYWEHPIVYAVLWLTGVSPESPSESVLSSILTDKDLSALREVPHLNEAADDSGFSSTYKMSDKKLGMGAFGVVMLATDLRTGKDVAVKCINSAKLTEEDEKRISNEVSLMKSLKHPHIVNFFGCYRISEEVRIVLEYAKGGELFDRIVSRDKYCEDGARKALRVILSTVSYLHSQSIVHRDLKPENILVLNDQDDSAIKISDFGLATYCEGPTLSAKCGSSYYIAPEILNGSLYGHSVDMWSIGVIAYILLCGYPPFHHHNDREMFRLICQGSYSFPSTEWSDISYDAKSFISGLLKVDVKKRFTATEALNHPWLNTKVSAISRKPLQTAVKNLKRFQALKKFRVAVKAVIAVNKFTTIGKNFRKVSEVYSLSPRTITASHSSGDTFSFDASDLEDMKDI